MLQKSLKTLLLCLTVTSLVFAQGLSTTASKDDWEEINFAFDSSVLTDGYPSLLRLAELLNQNSDHRVTLVGHADYLGSDQYNDQLALKRANTVKEFLEKYGARPGQITVEGRGETDPKSDQQTDEARFMNRRVEMSMANGAGEVVSAGGVGDLIEALEKLSRAQQECCDAILGKLDKLDDILAALNDLKSENAKLRDDIDSLKTAHSGLKQDVADIPKAPPAPSTQVLREVAEAAARKAAPTKVSRFSLLGINLGADDRGDVTFSGKARYFAPFGEMFAIQADAEYLGFRGRKEGQFDIGLVGRHKQFQLGGFSSFKHVSLSEYQRGGTLGQASVTADYIFSRGKVGVFGSKGFMDKALIDTRNISKHIIENTYLRTVDQAGLSWTVGMWKRNWLEGNFGYMRSRAYSDRPGGTVRFVFPFAERWAFTVEGGMNETMLGASNNGRFAAGVQFGNFIDPMTYAEVDHPIPVDIPRVRYELLTERVRTGNDTPVADAGPDLIGIAAGQITLDGSASFDPDGDPITFQWSQVAGPSIALAGAQTATASFTAADGQVYGFRLTVMDDQGAKSLDRVSISTKEAPRVRVMAFTATPASILIGGSATLTWQVENADEVTIAGVGAVNAQTGTAMVSPTGTTIYTLTAKNAVSEAQATVAVVVDKPEPSFIRCQVTPANIVEGETATLAWETAHASSVMLTGSGNVALTGSQMVSPAANTTYTLTATNSIGVTSCPLTVQVTKGSVPRIMSFVTNEREILAGTGTTLVWQVENADTVTIEGIGEVDPKTGSMPVSPTQTTNYLMTATNRFGSVVTTAMIVVVQPVQITSFTVNPSQLANPNDVFTLSWTTENATEVVISNGLGPRPASGSVPLQVAADTTYTIVASNRLSQATTSVTVTVAGP